MEIKINIDESKFREVLEKELGVFTQDYRFIDEISNRVAYTLTQKGQC